MKILDDIAANHTRLLDLAALERGVIEASVSPIPDDMSFAEWCEQLATAGMKVDNKPFDLTSRPALRFVYDLIPTTIEEALGQTIVLMKCSQVGFTVMEMLIGIYFALKFDPCTIGFFVPDRALAGGKSDKRFMPVVRSIPDAHSRLTQSDTKTGAQKKGEGNVMIRSMGGSLLHFLWTSGKVTTESYPMDVLLFDEVQGMNIADMEKAKERLSASRVKFTVMGSTANWLDMDIHFWYKKGKRFRFHTECPSCYHGNLLDEYFPDCIKFDADTRDYRYVCEECGGWMDDPQRGQWIAENPEAQITSIHFPQFLSPTISPREIIEAYIAADDMQNFFNRKLGKPYTDPSQVPVNMEMLNDRAKEGMAAGVRWQTSAAHTFMGIDQMGRFNCAIVKKRLPDGRQAVIHVEMIYADDPFARCDELMRQFGVDVCVVENLPNYNDAKAFAKRFEGRVFTAYYGDIADEMMRWGDADTSRADRKIGDEAREKYTVCLDQYKCMQTSMSRIAKGQCVFPDPQGLQQEVRQKGVRAIKNVLKDVVFLHFTRTALVAEKDEHERKFKRRVMKVGIDPHFSYANMLCDAAWARAHGTGTFLMPTADPKEEGIAKAQAAMPGLPTKVAEMMVAPTRGAVCGRCSAFQAGYCRDRDFMVQANDPGCPMFDPKEP